MRWRIFLPVFALTTFLSAASGPPLLSILGRFNAPNVPALGPNEIPVNRTWPDPTSTIERPGRGIAQHSMLYAGEGYEICSDRPGCGKSSDLPHQSFAASYGCEIKNVRSISLTCTNCIVYGVTHGEETRNA